MVEVVISREQEGENSESRLTIPLSTDPPTILPPESSSISTELSSEQGVPPRSRKRNSQDTKNDGDTDDEITKLINDHVSYAQYVVRRLISKLNLPIEMAEEFISAGYVGLVEAAARFDRHRQNDFKRYAFLRIRGAVIDSIRMNSELRGAAYYMAKAAMSATSVTQVELEDHDSESDRDALSDLVHATQLASTIYRLVYIGINYNFHSDGTLAKENAPDYRTKRQDRLKSLESLLDTLSPSERLVMEQFYFYDRSFTEIARLNPGLSKSWVSRLHAKAVSKLKCKVMQQDLTELLEEL